MSNKEFKTGEVREIFAEWIEEHLEMERRKAQGVGLEPSRIRAVRHAIGSVIEYFYGNDLERVPKMVFCDFLRALRREHPDFTKGDFGKALGRSAGWISCLTSSLLHQRHKCAIFPHQYRKILAVFLYPGDFVKPSGAYGQWKGGV